MAQNTITFVGRQKELDAFRSLLEAESSDSHLILIDGIGGIGKSELARQCIALAENTNVRTVSLDWNLTTPNTVSATLNMLADMLRDEFGNRAINTYLKTQKQQLDINARIVTYRENHPEVWQKLLDELSKVRETVPGALGKLAVTGIELLADLGPRATAQAREALIQQMAREKTLKNAQELALAQNPANQLARTLVQDIGKIANNRRHRLLIWLDTNEVLSAELEQFLRESIVCPMLRDTENVLVILGGRPSQHHERAVDAESALQMGYSGLLSPTQLTHWSLDELVYADVEAYLKPYTNDPKIIQFVMEKSRGIPFAMDLIRTMLDWDTLENAQTALDDLVTSGKLDEFVYQVTDRFLRYVQLHHPEDESDLFALALLLEPNDGAIQAMWGTADVRETRQRRQILTARYSFVNRDGSLHDVVRDFLREHMLGEAKAITQELAAKAGSFFKPIYERERALSRSLEEQVRDHGWQQATRDYLNALLWYNETSAVRLLLWSGIEASLFNQSFTRSLLQQTEFFYDKENWFATRSTQWIEQMRTGMRGDAEAVFDAFSVVLEDAGHRALRLTAKQQAVLQLSLSRTRLRQTQAESAFYYAKQAEENLNDDTSLTAILAGIYRDIGDALGFPKGSGQYHPIAMEAFTRGATLDPTDPWLFSGLGAMYQNTSDYENALKAYNNALKLDNQQSVIFSNRGTTYHTLQRYDEALADYAQAIKLNPDDATAFSNRGLTYHTLERYDEALADYAQAIHLNPQYATAFSNRGLTYHTLERYDEALADYAQAIHLNPQYATAFYNRGNTYADLERYDEALADYAQAIHLNPQYATAFYNRGTTYQKLERYDEALADYAQAIKLNPQYATAFSNRGNTYAKLERYDEALADYAQAIKLNPDYATAHFNTACLYALQSQAESACEWLAKAIELDKISREDARTDADFDPIRDTPCFQALVNPE